MIRDYWESLIVFSIFILLLLLLLVFTVVLTVKGSLSKRYCFVAAFVAFLGIAMCLYGKIIPSIKDYEYVSSDTIPEETMLMMEFTNVYLDTDGDGKMTYRKPKFYIEGKDEYVILYMTNVEVGKRYRIRYLPNTKISEIVECIE